MALWCAFPGPEAGVRGGEVSSSTHPAHPLPRLCRGFTSSTCSTQGWETGGPGELVKRVSSPGSQNVVPVNDSHPSCCRVRKVCQKQCNGSQEEMPAELSVREALAFTQGSAHLFPLLAQLVSLPVALGMCLPSCHVCWPLACFLIQS